MSCLWKQRATLSYSSNWPTSCHLESFCILIYHLTYHYFVIWISSLALEVLCHFSLAAVAVMRAALQTVICDTLVHTLENLSAKLLRDGVSKFEWSVFSDSVSSKDKAMELVHRFSSNNGWACSYNLKKKNAVHPQFALLPQGFPLPADQNAKPVRNRWASMDGQNETNLHILQSS